MSAEDHPYLSLQDQRSETEQQQYGFKPPPYTPDIPAPVQPPVTVAVIQTPAPQQFGPEPSRTTCPSCRAIISTRIDHQNSTKTHIIALILCLFGLWPCCFIPYCVDSCKNANHYCPSCNAFLGTYKG